jgi:ADP-heptose:LPS heptosyltransferase
MTIFKKVERFFYRKMLFFIKKPSIVLNFGNGMGDDLLCTIILKQLKEKKIGGIWFKTLYPEIFKQNRNVDKVIKKNRNNKTTWSIYDKYLEYNRIKTIYPFYTSRNSELDQDDIPNKHIIQIMCETVGVPYNKTLAPEFYLNTNEIKKGRINPNQICIQSSGMNAKHYMNNKEWYPERFNQVAKYLKNEFFIIQIGSESDPLLDCDLDLRGKTTIRETAAILKNSKFFVGLVGGLMHLSKSVNCKSIIIYGGRETPEQSGYDSNVNIYSNTHCSPCWRWNTCDFNKSCMDLITAEDVVSKIKLCNMNCNDYR